MTSTKIYSNVFIGDCAGILLEEGSGNLFIGPGAGSGIRKGSNNIILGNASGVDGDGQFIIGKMCGPELDELLEKIQINKITLVADILLYVLNTIKDCRNIKEKNKTVILPDELSS